MNYFIVEKIECVNDELVCTEIGYVLTHQDCEYINNNGYVNLINWLTANEVNRKLQEVTLSECPYFPCYGSRSSTNNIDNTNLSLITNLDNPENI